MKIQFSKYHGAGNDFIIIDNLDGHFDTQNQELIMNLCSFHTGIGADGLILLESHPDLDYRMVYFNRNGTEASFCGNGARCLLAFAIQQGVVESTSHFEAFDGYHEAAMVSNDFYKVLMQPVHEIVSVDAAWQLDTGSPHYVIFSTEILNKNIIELAQKIRFSPAFSEAGINVDLVEETDKGSIKIRTYERGVEDETLACGTGVVAASIAYAKKNQLSGDISINVEAIGGNLQVHCNAAENDHFRNIWLLGPAIQVFDGYLEY